MERRLSQGDYVPDGGGGLTALGDGEEVLARVLFRLTAHRGAMPFLPELGSRLYLLGREKPSARQALAAQYVAEALREETDLQVRAVELEPGEYPLPGDVSSQFVTGLLYALSLLEGDSRMEMTSPLQSRGYVEMTLETLRAFGIQVENQGYKRFLVPGGQLFASRDTAIEGDWSQGGFWYAAKALGNPVTIQGLREDSPQGDRVVAEHFSLLCQPGDTEIDLTDCPDLLPPLAVMAAGRKVSQATRRGRLPCCRLSIPASLAPLVVLPAPLRPTSITTVGGFGEMVSLVLSPPMRAVSSSLTIFTIICAGVRLSSTSAPTARSVTVAVNCLTTLKFTSASRRARRISRMAALMSSSVRRPFDRRPEKMP